MSCQGCCLAHSGRCTSAAAGRLPLSLCCCPRPAHCRRAGAALPGRCLPRCACSDAAGGRRPLGLRRHLPGFGGLQIAPHGLRQSIHQGTSPLQDGPGCLHQAGLLEQLAPCRQAQSQHRCLGYYVASDWQTFILPWTSGPHAFRPSTCGSSCQMEQQTAVSNVTGGASQAVPVKEKQHSADGGLPTRCWGTKMLCVLHT